MEELKRDERKCVDVDRSGIPGGQDTMEEERNGAIVREGHEARASVIVLLSTGYRSSWKRPRLHRLTAHRQDKRRSSLSWNLIEYDMIALETVTHYLATITYSLTSKLWSVKSKWFTLETLPVNEEISSTWLISRNKFEKRTRNVLLT